MIRSLVFTQNCGEQDAAHPGIKLTHDRWNSFNVAMALFPNSPLQGLLLWKQKQ